VKDYIGAFCNASFGLEPIVAQYKADGDDYSYIMAEALADRRAHLHLCATVHVTLLQRFCM
jgi:5-methyltetrahydrofolate--homocysteine methyltransferase